MTSVPVIRMNWLWSVFVFSQGSLVAIGQYLSRLSKCMGVPRTRIYDALCVGGELRPLWAYAPSVVEEFRRIISEDESVLYKYRIAGRV